MVSLFGVNGWDECCHLPFGSPSRIVDSPPLVWTSILDPIVTRICRELSSKTFLTSALLDEVYPCLTDTHNPPVGVPCWSPI